MGSIRPLGKIGPKAMERRGCRLMLRHHLRKTRRRCRACRTVLERRTSGFTKSFIIYLLCPFYECNDDYAMQPLFEPIRLGSTRNG
jgi:hypothetical protein